MPDVKKPEIYVSVDIETDGQVAGLANMLSCGSVAYLDGKEIDSFYFKLETRPEFKADPSTMKWWSTQPTATWEEARANAVPAEVIMPIYRAWLEALPGKPIFCGTPAAWDFSFVWYYLNRFAGTCPFSHRGLDIRSYAMGKLKSPTFLVNSPDKKLWDQFRTYKPVMEHNALEDAREQGVAFMNLMAYNPQLTDSKGEITRLEA